MGRILCLDVGEKRTGVAVTDELQIIARGLPTIHHDGSRQLLEAVSRLLTEQDIERIVVGLPLSLSGKPSTRSESIRRFAGKLGRATKLPIDLFDESLSTVRANEVLEQTYGRPKARTKRPGTGTSKSRRVAVDRIAATIILQDFLAERNG